MNSVDVEERLCAMSGCLERANVMLRLSAKELIPLCTKCAQQRELSMLLDGEAMLVVNRNRLVAASA